MGITTVTTLRSIYQVDQEHRRVRRIVGLAPPTLNQQRYADREGWARYTSVEWLGAALLFVWEVDEETKTVRRTATSTVVGLDGPLIPETMEDSPIREDESK